MNRRRARPGQGVWGMNAALLAACLPVVFVAPARPLLAGWNSRPAIAAFTLAFGLMELVVFHVRLGTERHTISWNEAVVVLGMAFLPTRTLMAAHALGLGTFLLWHRRQAAVRWTFNIGQTTFSLGLGALAAHGVAGLLGDVNGPWMGAFVGAALTGALGAAFVSIVVSIAESRRPELRRMVGMSSVVGIGASAGGVVLGVIARLSLPLAVFPLMMFGLLAIGHQAYLRARLRADESAFLNEATLALNGSSDPETSVVHLLAATCRALHVREAALIEDFGDDQWIIRWIDRSEPGSPLHSSIGNRPGWLAQTSCVVAADAFDDGRTGGALTAPIRSDRGVIGVLVARDRAGEFGPFEGPDHSLIETATGLLSLHLETGELRRDIHNLHEAEREMRHLALHDALTGLPNRRQLDLHAQARAATHPGGPLQLSIAVIDLDGFKQVNDTLGHAAGDALLVEVASRLQSVIRDGDLAVRLGGDEFALLAGTEPAELAQRVEAAFAEAFVLDGSSTGVGASVGVAPVVVVTGHASGAAEENRQRIEGALSAADRNMYDMKARHKGCTVDLSGVDADGRS